jgi:hypothetical protein
MVVPVAAMAIALERYIRRGMLIGALKAERPRRWRPVGRGFGPGASCAPCAHVSVERDHVRSKFGLTQQIHYGEPRTG